MRRGQKSRNIESPMSVVEYDRLHSPNSVKKISTIENKLNIVLSRGKGGGVMALYTCHYE